MEASSDGTTVCLWLTGAWVTLEQTRAGGKGVKRGDGVMRVQVEVFTTPGPGNFADKDNQLSWI